MRSGGVMLAMLWAACGLAADSPGPELVVQTGHTGTVDTACFSPNGKWLLTGGDDNICRLWDAETGLQARSFRGHRATFSPDGKTVLTATEPDYVARLWDLETGRELQTFVGHKGFLATILSVSFSPDGKRVVMGGTFSAATFDTATGKEVQAFKGWSGVHALAISPNGEQVLTDGYEFDGLKLTYRAVLRDAVTGKPIRAFEGHSESIIGVAFAPNGKTILTRSDDRTVRLWDVTTGKPLHVLGGHPGRARTAAFTPDGKHVWTGAADGVRCWDAATGAELARLVYPAGGGWLIVTPNGRYDASPEGRQLVAFRGAGNAVAVDGRLLKERHRPGLLAEVLGGN